MHVAEKIASHFEPLHEMLTELSAQSDAAWIEGGMVWSFEFQKRAATTLKTDPKYAGRSKVNSCSTNLLSQEKEWAKFIWNVQGDRRSLENLAGGRKWDDEKNRLIGECEDQAQWIINCFETSGANLVHMDFLEDVTSMSFECVSLFGRDALTHKFFWSMD